MNGSVRRRTVATLVLMAVAATALNLGKAVHIDDTAHLEIARAILRDPLHAMSAPLNWKDAPEPIHHLNQPHLVFALMAGVMAVFGESELALHVVLGLFTALCVFHFHRLARRLVPGSALLATALFCLGPAFLPSQNLMVDVPMTAMWLGFFDHLLAAEDAADPRRGYRSAALYAAAGCLTKYTSLALLPILAVGPIFRRRWSLLGFLLIPLTVLAAWSAWNLIDYGGVHLLGRSLPETDRPATWYRAGSIAVRLGLWVIGLGAVAPFGVLLWPELARQPRGRRALLGAALMAVATAVVGRIARPGEPVVQSWLRGAFLANGALVLGIALVRLRSAGPWAAAPVRRAVLSAWLAGAIAFIAVFSPFIAVRHVLPVLPALLLVLLSGPAAPGTAWRRAALTATLVMGALVGVSDWKLADVYRKEAAHLASELGPGGHTMWALGHWGWQWYAGKNGLRRYDAGARLASGDLVIAPYIAHKQKLPAADESRLVLREERQVSGGPLTALRTYTKEGGFYYFWTAVPWTITTAPLEIFRVYTVAR